MKLAASNSINYARGQWGMGGVGQLLVFFILRVIPPTLPHYKVSCRLGFVSPRAELRHGLNWVQVCMYVCMYICIYLG